MKRRHFLMTGAATLVVASLPTAYLVVDEESPEKLTLESVFQRLELIKSSRISFAGSWSSYHLFVHLAQSIEFSITGYPVHKSDTFKSTLGYLAFNAFQGKGRMHHNLEEDIPGAAVEVEGDLSEAIIRFEKALIGFEKHTGELQPHFAYGRLSKDEYRLAHIMHFNNHMTRLIT